MSSLTHADYTIAWICALPPEAAAARAMLDRTHDSLPVPSSDPNAYTLGEVNGHNIVITYLPAGVIGKVSAATVVSRMRSTFPQIQSGLMVGIGGGVPGKNNDIRLGDVVVSKPVGKHGGVIQYDYGKTLQGGKFEFTGSLNKPPQAFLTCMSQLETKQIIEGKNNLDDMVRDALERHPSMKENFSLPEQDTDLLFDSSCHHAVKGDTCDKCDRDQLVERSPRKNRAPSIHYGLIASGDQVMKDSETRDLLAKQHGVLCFEMEAAGLMDGLPSLVIRGICDYCDSHKQKGWQGYAALVAAAYTKLLLSVVPVSGTNLGSKKNNRVRHWMVPLARNPRFIGREDEITKLERLFKGRDGPRRVAITGLGGVGKTQVALELAYRIRDRDEGCSVFWIPCTSQEMIDQTYLDLAQELGLQDMERIDVKELYIEHPDLKEFDLKRPDVKERVKEYLESEIAGKWLLIFDNADDMDTWLPTSCDSASGLAVFLPQSEHGRILFTSRNRKLAVDLTVSNIISIPDVNENVALQILERSLVQHNLIKNHDTTETLLEKLCFLPLAITQASAYINKNGVSLSAYLDLLEDQESEVVDLLSEDFQDTGRYKDIKNPVIATWLISFKQIQKQDQLAADYLSFMCCLNPRNVPSSLLPMPTTRKHQIDALGLLDAYCFINGHDNNINMHRLVHIATRNWLRQNELFRYWIKEVADHLQEVLSIACHETGTGRREYIPHAWVLMHETEFITMRQERYMKMTEDMAYCLVHNLKYREADELYTELLKIKNESCGPEDPMTLKYMLCLAKTYSYGGKLDDAEKLMLQVMETAIRVLGSKSPLALRTIYNLALVYLSQGRGNEAENLISNSIETQKANFGVEHRPFLNSKLLLGEIYRGQGRFNEAEKLDLQVTETLLRAFGRENHLSIKAMGHLALDYEMQGRWDEAEKLQLEVMESNKKICGPDHIDTIVSMGILASTYRNKHCWDEAETLGVQVFEKTKTILGLKHPLTLDGMLDLANLYLDQKRCDEAEKLIDRVVQTRKAVLGARHTQTLHIMSKLAQIYAAQERWDETENLELHVLEAMKVVRGVKHPDTLRMMARLASTRVINGKSSDALSLMKECSDLYNEALGPNHPDAKKCSLILSEWMDEYQSSTTPFNRITLAIRDGKSRLKRSLGANRHHIRAKFSWKGDQMGTDG
ncbi:Nephrocystin-3 [Talaromyces pinophilus]|nr:Nephrocystin-3 [Talaromyces pinophilus]